MLVWVHWGLTPPQQPGSYQGGETMMMKSVFWWRKPEYPEETTDLRQVTDETFHTYGLCRVRGLNLGRSGVKQSELRRDESGALAHRATAVPHWMLCMLYEVMHSRIPFSSKKYNTDKNAFVFCRSCWPSYKEQG